MKRSPHLATTGAIYVYFAVYGSAVIAISQSSAHLQQQWGATEGQVLQAVAGVGVGKVVGPLFAGFLSDRFGRRPSVVTGLVLVGAFLGALLVSPTWQAGFALAVLFGLANAVGDTGSYPTLMEAFPARAGTANVLAKAAIAVGQLVLPLAVTATAAAGLAWGTPFAVLLAVVAVLVAVQLRARFPDRPVPDRDGPPRASAAVPSADGPDLFVSDVVYSPARTAFLEQAEAAGCRTMNGLGMMLHQGAAAFELWTGQPMPVDHVRAELFG
ncbi:MFS transporter [Cellulomonas sp. NPDC058312]|uniref:MFS transporter n=1 Tax=Cellulomonas sp. NPDC058312 TaxID=3346441 RepID=UPI0036EEFD1B